MKFHGRTRELSQLNAELGKASPSLIIVSGRRRIGKSTWLKHAVRNHRHVYFQATIGPSIINLQGFKDEISRATGTSPLLDGISTWEGIFHYLADMAKNSPGLVVIIDEFPYLLEDDKSLPSVLQRFWDSGVVRDGNFKLVLCGSAISQMRALLSESNPLYGRNTKRFELSQLPLRDMAAFFPNYTAEDIIQTYAVFGGVPHYLSLCDPDQSFRQNVVDLLMEESGALLDEPEFLMKTEFDKPRMYSGVLSAIAGGRSSLGEIANRLNVAPTDLSVYIDRLRVVELVKVDRSLHADDRSKNRRYRLNDQLLSFWHEFVGPNRSAIANGFGDQIFDHILARGFPDFMGAAFEEICRQYVARHLDELTGGVPASEVGSLWGFKDFDIDVAGRLPDSTAFFGEVKWRSSRIDMGMVRKLQGNAQASGFAKHVTGNLYLFFSRSGFKPEVIKDASIDASLRLVDPEMILGWREPKPKDDFDQTTSLPTL